MTQDQRGSATSESEFVRESQIDPVAGIWACDNCGRRIQLITDSDMEKVQSFICVCGSEKSNDTNKRKPTY
jgi:hypothetical protein